MTKLTYYIHTKIYNKKKVFYNLYYESSFHFKWDIENGEIRYMLPFSLQ